MRVRARPRRLTDRAGYFGPERTSPRYSPATCAKDHPEHSELTYRKCWADTVEPPGVDASIKLVFSKDMVRERCCA